MKKVNRCVAVMIVLSVLLTVSCQTAGISQEDRLGELAKAYITLQYTENDDVINATYSNLQGFYAAVYVQFPDISDQELAAFVMHYTQQGDLEDFPEEMVSEILGAYSISGTIQELTNGVLDSAELECTSEDGYMKIKLFALNKGINSEGYRYYYVWAVAEWLKIPFWRFTDTLAITYGGYCNANDGVAAYFKQKSKCSVCSQTYTTFCEDRFENGKITQNQSGIELDFSQGGAVGAKFQLQDIGYCSSDVTEMLTDTEMIAFISCYTWVDSLCEIKGAYAHKTLADITIGGSVDASGRVTPEFSVGIGAGCTPYATPAIVLNP